MTNNTPAALAASPNQQPLPIQALLEQLVDVAIDFSADDASSLREKFAFDPMVVISRFEIHRLKPELPQCGSLLLRPPPSVGINATNPHTTLLLNVSAQGEIGLSHIDFDSLSERRESSSVALKNTAAGSFNGESTNSFLGFVAWAFPSHRPIDQGDLFEIALRQREASTDVFSDMRRAWFAAILNAFDERAITTDRNRDVVHRLVGKWVETFLPSLSQALDHLHASESLVWQIQKLEAGDFTLPARSLRVIELNLVSQFAVYDRLDWLRSFPPSVTEPELYLAADQVLERVNLHDASSGIRQTK